MYRIRSHWYVVEGRKAFFSCWLHDLVWLPMFWALDWLGFESLATRLHRWSEPDNHCCCRF